MDASPQPQRTVFLSYSVRDKPVATRFANALETNNIPVWWDLDTIPLGADWTDYLLNQVSTALCAVVLWSAQSIRSEWVIRECEVAARRSVLIPVLIEDVPIPDRFSRIQTAMLVNWDGNPANPDFTRLVSGVRRFMDMAPSPAETTRVLKASQRSAARRAEDLFKLNLRSECVLEYVDLEKTPFYDQLSWNLNPRINILLGRNGYGKTYLLRGMLALLQYNDDVALETLGEGSGTICLLSSGEERQIQFAKQYFEEDTAVGKLPVLAIPDMRFINRSTTTLSAVSDETTGTGDRADLASYGAWHFLQERPYESMIQSFLYGLCLDYFENKLQFEGEQFELIRGVVRELTDSSFEFDRVAREGRDRFTLYVRTEGNEANPLPIQKASQGTTSVIAMFGLIHDFLKSLRQESTPEICKRTGIVLIDEVDAHLHPLWQQKIVSLFRSRFPHVQFIITAHNPIVVAGCLEDEVSVLRKKPEHGFSLVQFPNDFVGWQPEEIYRKVFEIENPDDTFARFDAMRPFKAQLEQQAASLESRGVRNPDENRSLEEVQEKLLYIQKVEQTRSRRLSQEELERENRTLQERLLGREFQTLKAQVVEAQSALEKSEQRQRLLQYLVIFLAVLSAVVLIIMFTNKPV